MARDRAAPGALANYTISAEDHFQERLECWLDVLTRVAGREQDRTRLRSLPGASAG